MADRLDLDAIRRHAAIGGLGWTTETVAALCDEVERLRRVEDDARRVLAVRDVLCLGGALGDLQATLDGD